MPGRNIVKYYEAEAYYHVYNRGVNLRKIFRDGEDFKYFEWLLERSVGPKEVQDSKGRSFTWLRDKVRLNAYCLMPNHFHLLVYQEANDGVSSLMRSLGTAYTGYFNKKYRRRGPLFENTYRSVPIEKDSQFMHITRYIHLNYPNYKTWAHSSYKDYLVEARTWVDSEPILAMFDSKKEYVDFVNDYKEMHKELSSLKSQLADNI